MKKISGNELVRIAMIVFLFSACNSSIRKATGEDTKSGTAQDVPDFAVVQSKVFQPRCVSCHSQYATYAGVRREIDSIAAAIESDRMPKNGRLSDSLKALVREWVRAGAPEFAGQNPSPPEPVELRPIWSSVSENIISPRCLVCHNPSGQAKFLDLSTREIIYANRDRSFGDGQKLIDIENPEKSYLIQVIQDDVEPMPPVWSSIRRLNADEVQILKEWIGLGLP